MLPPTSTEVLHYALVLSEEGSLSRAAERLHVSHSQISRKLKALQSTWGVPLFDRTLSGFAPTEEGRAALDEIRSSLQHADRSYHRARFLSASRRGPLRVGLAPYIHASIAPLLRRGPIPSDQYSGLSLKVGSTPTLVRHVLSGHLHIAFGVMPILDRELWIQPVREEGFCACIPEQHSFRERSRLALRELTSQPLIWMARSAHPRFYEEGIRYFQSVGFGKEQIVGANNYVECLEFAASGFGCGLLPAAAMPLRRAGVLIKPITDSLLRIQTVAFARKDQVMSGIAKLILDEIL